MSIATDEAKKNFSLPDNHGAPAFDLYWLRDQQQQAYVAGRTAEPTEAEIEAATIAAYKYYFDSRGNTITLEIAKHDVQRFNGSTDEFSDPDVNYARNIATVVLAAARKAVTGDECGY